VALEARIGLTELRHAECGLEDMFLQLTADTQRENTRQGRRNQKRETKQERKAA
jgi:ABC-2 type transport system ATP-binding protein